LKSLRKQTPAEKDDEYSDDFESDDDKENTNKATKLKFSHKPKAIPGIKINYDFSIIYFMDSLLIDSLLIVVLMNLQNISNIIIKIKVEKANNL